MSHPVRTDGRDIDPSLGSLLGEGSHQRSGPVDRHLAEHAAVWRHTPESDEADPTYYDRPLLKRPVWKPYIPAYYFVGGITGASLVLAAAAQLDGSPRLRKFIRRGQWTGLAGASISGVLLIADLGRPERFLNMLRVFRPTSPMNVGAWILAATPAAASGALLLGALPRPLHGLGRIAGYGAGVLGLGLSTYTGVLVSGSAIPVWQESRHVLPILFGSSAIAATGSLFDLAKQRARAGDITRAFGIAGRVAELAASFALERRLSRVPEVEKPLKQGLSGFLWRSAGVLTAASLGALLLASRGGKTRGGKARKAASALGLLGSLAMRFAIHYAGEQSAANPRASFRLQRPVE